MRILGIDPGLRATGFGVIDRFSRTNQTYYRLSGDDLHPNAAGYAIMAPLAEAAIQKALTTK